MKYILWAFLLVGLSSCCSKTTLVLLPDEDGTVGKVVMQTTGGSLKLDQPYAAAITQSGRSAPQKKVLDKKTFDDKWGDLATMESQKPQSFLLYFHSGSAILTKESQTRLPDVMDAMRQDDPVEISIIGHSDAVGDEEDNYVLSFKRAQAVHELLKGKIPRVKRVHVDSFGENDPLIPTADNIPEPRNRRVEIMIR